MTNREDGIRSSPHYGCERRHSFTHRTKAFAGGTIRNSCVTPGPVGVLVLNQVSDFKSESEMGSDAPPGVRERNSTPSGIPLLKPGRLLRRYPWKNVVLLKAGSV